MSRWELTCKHYEWSCPNKDCKYETCNKNCPYYVNKEEDNKKSALEYDNFVNNFLNKYKKKC